MRWHENIIINKPICKNAKTVYIYIYIRNGFCICNNDDIDTYTTCFMLAKMYYWLLLIPLKKSELGKTARSRADAVIALNVSTTAETDLHLHINSHAKKTETNRK